MSDPKRLLEGAELSGRAAALLRAGKAYRAPEAMLARSREALGLGAVASAAATKAGVSLGWKLFGALVGVSVAGGALFVGRAPTQPPQVLGGSEPAPAALAPVGSGDSPEAEATAAVEADAPRAERSAAPLPERTPPKTAAAVAAPAAPSSNLAEEVRLLQEAQRELGRDPKGAQKKLEEHARRFGAGALGEEATVLRVQTLKASGDHAGAAAVGQQFLQKYPQSAHAARVRALIAGGP